MPDGKIGVGGKGLMDDRNNRPLYHHLTPPSLAVSSILCLAVELSVAPSQKKWHRAKKLFTPTTHRLLNILAFAIWPVNHSPTSYGMLYITSKFYSNTKYLYESNLPL